MRRAYVEGMCEEATSDLLSWSLEKALSHGAAQVEHMHACIHACPQQLLCERRKAERTASLAGGRLEDFTCAYAQSAVQAIFHAYSGHQFIANAAGNPTN